MNTLAPEQLARGPYDDPFIECDTASYAGPPTCSIIDAVRQRFPESELLPYDQAASGGDFDLSDPCFNLTDAQMEALATDIEFFILAMKSVRIDKDEYDRLRHTRDQLMQAYLRGQLAKAPYRPIEVSSDGPIVTDKYLYRSGACDDADKTVLTQPLRLSPAPEQAHLSHEYLYGSPKQEEARIADRRALAAHAVSNSY